MTAFAEMATETGGAFTFKNCRNLKLVQTDSAAAFVRVTETKLDEVPENSNILGRNLSGFLPVPTVPATADSSASPRRRRVLASVRIDVPTKKGKYLIEVYPTMGLSTSGAVTARPSQCVTLRFPTSGVEFSTPFYKMVSKDPNGIAAKRPVCGVKRKFDSSMEDRQR